MKDFLSFPIIFINFLYFACIHVSYLLKYNRCEFSLNLRSGGATMAKCSICNKGAHFGIAVSHSHRRSNKMWKSNVKSVRVKVNGAAKKMYVCTACLRSGKVERA